MFIAEVQKTMSAANAALRSLIAQVIVSRIRPHLHRLIRSLTQVGPGEALTLRGLRDQD